MSLPSNFKSAVDHAAAINAEWIRRYRESAQGVRNPAVRRLMVSVLDQKTSQADLLRAVSESEDPGGDLSASRELPRAIAPSGLPPEEQAVPPADTAAAPKPDEDSAADLLRMVQTGEEDLGALFETLRGWTTDAENQERLHSLSEISRKIGDWVRDHLELLSLF